nr:PH domain-containing protein [Candidatus Woesearchaeota archaeon]
MNQLHPGARWIFRFNSYSRFGFIFFILIYFLIIPSLITNLYFFSLVPGLEDFGLRIFFGDSVLIRLIELLIPFIFILIIGEIYARMGYNRWLYEITNDGIKIEHGIIWKKYTSIPYEKVQNVDIKRGIIARMIGFSSVEIETAGQSGFGGRYEFRFWGREQRRYHSEGYLPAIDVNGAEKIREFIMKKIKQTHRGEQGL